MNPEDVKHLATLARIELSPEEEVSFAHDMGAILEYVSAIKKAEAPKSELSIHRNVFRADEVTHAGGSYREALLEAAPLREGDYVRVKKILS